MTSSVSEDLPEQKMRRKLVAIFYADVAGYSRLMSVDEEDTSRRLTAHRSIMDTMIDHFGGRIANTAGDSVLAEFPSSVEAVRCALAVQEALLTKNEGLPKERWLQFRIGVNAGDVIQQGDDLLGEGINVAARLEAIAEPGGICISADVKNQIEGKLTLQCISLGSQRLKNIGRAVLAFKITSQDAEALKPPSLLNQFRINRSSVVAVLFVVFLISATIWLWEEKPVTAFDQSSPPDGVPESDDGSSRDKAPYAILQRANFGKNEYLLLGSTGIKWDAAETSARDLGGHLVAIGSQEEHDFIVRMVQDEDRVWKRRDEGTRWQRFGPWIGLVQRDKAIEPDFGWVWSNGEPLEYENWFEFQPDNFDGIEDFVRLREFSDLEGIKWDDARLNYTAKGYVVEIENQ